MQTFKEKLEEQEMLQEFDMGFMDWIMAGAGIELGRIGVGIGIALFLATLYIGLASGEKLLTRVQDYLRRRKGNKAAYEAEKWIAKQTLFDDVKRMSKDIKELTAKRDRSKSEKNRSELAKVISKISSNRKSLKKQIAIYLESSYENGDISKEATKWIVFEAYLQTYMTNPELVR